MKHTLAWAAVVLLVGCGGGAGGGQPTQTAEAAALPSNASPAPATSPEPAAHKDTAKPEATVDGAGDGAWQGEAEAKAAPAPAAAASAETRSMEVIAQVVKDNRKPVRECFDKVKRDLPDLRGDMVVHFVIDPAGKVKQAELNQERSTLKAPAVVECAIRVIRGIEFPPSSRGMDTTVNYPFNLN